MDIVSAQHDELIAALYEQRNRLKRISRDESLIVEMAIQMLEFMDEHAAGASAEEHLTSEDHERLEGRANEARRLSRIRWSVDDFERLICSGGFELHNGRLVPRF
jgi:hypothetical protein